MHCPACKEPMVVLELDQVEIDYCFGCQGIWLDAGELELLLDDAHLADAYLHAFERDTRTTEKPRKCPICDKKMEKVRYGPNQETLIDRCGKNNDGIWFDHGELLAILKSGGDKNNRVLHLLHDMLGADKDRPE